MALAPIGRLLAVSPATRPIQEYAKVPESGSQPAVQQAPAAQEQESGAQTDTKPGTQTDTHSGIGFNVQPVAPEATGETAETTNEPTAVVSAQVREEFRRETPETPKRPDEPTAEVPVEIPGAFKQTTQKFHRVNNG
jgi:hypothetical protein